MVLKKTECYTNQPNSAITDVGIGHYVRFDTRGNDKMGVACVWWEKRVVESQKKSFLILRVTN